MLRDGDLWLDQLGPAHRDDAQLRSFMRERVRIEVDDSLTRESCRVVLHSRTGESTMIDVAAARGTPADPLLPAEVDAKFHRCVDPHLGQEAAGALLDRLRKIEAITDLAPVFAALRGRPVES